MPKLRSQQGPIIRCAFVYCDIHFRQWRRRLYCSDRCRKQAWRVAHRPYYAQQAKDAWEKKKAERRRERRYEWVEGGHEDKAPERITLAEALAQARPEILAQVKELLVDVED